MKKIYKLVLVSYLGPFVLTFFISIFILLMQFLWKYVDDLVGKGLEWHVIIELLLYASASLVPLALPLAILLSSVMAFGNLGENHELEACKAVGVSLQKVMTPLIVFSVLVSLLAFYFANNVLPYANLKMGTLLYDVRQQKPAFALKEGFFYNGIEGYSLKVGKKDRDGKTLYDIMIYDHSLGMGNTKLITAKSGNMAKSDDDRFLVLTLHNGSSYEEIINTDRQRRPAGLSRPFLRTDFEEEVVRFDLSGFRFTRTDEDLFKDNYQMLNLSQLGAAEDTLAGKMNERIESFVNELKVNFLFKVDSHLYAEAPSCEFSGKGILYNFPVSDRAKIAEMAAANCRSAKLYISNFLDDIDSREKTIIRHQVEWHRKLTFSFACMVLFFIGVPLGAIIRKGGLGIPMIVSTVFFVIFYLISISGEKFAKEGIIPPIAGMWLASAVLLPLGIFFTVKATRDSSLFDITAYMNLLKKIFRKILFR